MNLAYIKDGSEFVLIDTCTEDLPMLCRRILSGELLRSIENMQQQAVLQPTP